MDQGRETSNESLLVYLPAGADRLLARLHPLHELDAALAKKDNAQARKLAQEARDLIAAMPVKALGWRTMTVCVFSPAAFR